MVEQQNKYLDIRLEGKKLKQRDSFVYLGGVICGDGGFETDIRWRMQAGANALIKVEVVMGDRHDISDDQRIGAYFMQTTTSLRK